MKTEEEFASLKKEVEESGSTLNILTDKDLKAVAGGFNDATMMEGTAGAYSGSRTATGETVDDCSMGVAIPMSWPNYRSYFGKTIMINYGGRTVLATINDIGALTGRDLDLQPGVIRSFGFTSCKDWGFRPVSYFIL